MNIKFEYEEPQINIIIVTEEDIITTSGHAWEIVWKNS